MDNLAHALVGAALMRAVADRHVPRAGLIGVVAANVPDWSELFIGLPGTRADFLVLHRGNSDALQRMINAMEPGSYMRPHRHHTPPKAESLVLLSGSLGLIAFHDDGTLDYEDCVLLDRNVGAIALDCRESIWHILTALEPGTAFFEAKSGPFDTSGDKEFAPWAPDESVPEAMTYLKRRLNGHGGMILLDARGRFGIAHNTPRMAWAYKNTEREKDGIHC